MATVSAPSKIAAGVITMHSVTCPSCGTQVEVDFRPIAGLVWCPTCQKLFSPPVVSGPHPQKTDKSEVSEEHDGEAS